MKFLRYCIVAFLLALLSFSFVCTNTYAATNPRHPVITVINPIRGNELGHDGENLLPGLQAQWQDTKEANIQATWLWQYSALENKPLVDFAKSDMRHQEFGLFLEIDRNFATKAHVQYRGRGPWYFSDGLLLVSYDPDERKKLIDTAFTEFKQTFGYYPKTVGAWWIGADSLTYMHDRYGITGAMRAADQFNLDVYTIWGTPWSISYVASKENEGIPASSFTNSSGVVMMQWAVRDPTQGYGNSPDNSTYSIQDFSLKNYDFSYVDYLLSIYANQPFDQVVIGLENNASPTIYGQGTYYQQMLTKVAMLRDKNRVTVLPAQVYTHAFLAQQVIAPTHYFLTKDFTTNDQSFWYNAPTYRVGIRKQGNHISLIDLRDYQTKTPEAFNVLPNSQGFLKVNTPAIIDSAYLPQQQQLLATTDKPLQLLKSGNLVTLFAGQQLLGTFTDNSFNIHTISLDNTKTHATGTVPLVPIIIGIYMLYGLLLTSVFLQSKSYTIKNATTWKTLTRWRNFQQRIHYGIVSYLLLLLPLFFLYPFPNSDQTFFIDKKTLILSPLLLFVPGSPLFRMTIVFDVLPIVLLLVIHYCCFVRWHNQIAYTIYYCVVGGVTLLYVHIPYFPLDRSTYVATGCLLGVFFFLCVAGGTILLRKRKARTNILILYDSAVFLFFVALMGCIIVSRSTDVVVPFEGDAIQVLTKTNKGVVYLLPTDKPIYKAVKPLLYDVYPVGGFLTRTQWQIVRRDVHNNLLLTALENKFVLIPRYLGSDITPEEIRHYHLATIFDNAEIAIFEQKNKD